MTDPKAAAEAVLTPTTFDFAEAVLDRSYPEFNVPVYLDEASVQVLVESDAKRIALEQRIAQMKSPGVKQAEALNKLQEEYEAAVESLKDKAYIVKIKGIAPEEQIALDEKVYELIPREYEETQSPVTGAITRTELPNDKRDEEFATLLRQAHLVSVTRPDGAVDSNWSDKEKVRAMFARLPLVARAKIDEAINNCTIAVDFYRNLADEVF